MSDGILPVNSKVIVGIIIADNALDKATCQADSSTLLLCNTEYVNEQKPQINPVKTEESSVTWKKYENLKLNVKYVSKYEYDINLGQFKFNMIILDEGIPLNTLTSINALYKFNSAWASCVLIESNKFACSLVYEQQESSGSVTIVYSSSKFKNRDSNVKFVNHLFFGRGYTTNFVENKWKFNIELTDSNLKDEETYVIDIKSR